MTQQERSQELIDLAEEITSLCETGDSPLTLLLMKCQRLAALAGCKDIELWTSNELQGIDVEIPELMEPYEQSAKDGALIRFLRTRRITQLDGRKQALSHGVGELEEFQGMVTTPDGSMQAYTKDQAVFAMQSAEVLRRIRSEVHAVACEILSAYKNGYGPDGAPAETEASPGTTTQAVAVQARKFALLVGVNHYREEDFRDLPFASADAMGLAEVLREPACGGFDTIHVLCDTEEGADGEPSRSDILSQLTRMCNYADEGDTLLVFFACHGCTDDDDPYLLCRDARSNVLRNTAISLGMIKDELRKSAASARVLLLDACHADARAGRGDENLSRAVSGLVEQAEGFVALSACSRNEVSYEDGELGHGVFTYWLVEGLRGAADANHDGVVSVSELFAFVHDNVREWAFSRDKKQTPTQHVEAAGDVALSLARFAGVEAQAAKRIPDASQYIQEIEIRGHFRLRRDEKSSIEWAEDVAARLAGRLSQEYPLGQIQREKKRYGDEQWVRFPAGALRIEVARLFSKEMAITIQLPGQPDWSAKAIYMFDIVDGITETAKWQVCSFQLQGCFDMDKVRTLFLSRGGKPEVWDPARGNYYRGELIWARDPEWFKDPEYEPSSELDPLEPAITVEFRTRKEDVAVFAVTFDGSLSVGSFRDLVISGLIDEVLEYFLPALGPPEQA